MLTRERLQEHSPHLEWDLVQPTALAKRLREEFLPAQIEKGSIYYDLKKSPQKYLEDESISSQSALDCHEVYLREMTSLSVMVKMFLFPGSRPTSLLGYGREAIRTPNEEKRCV